MKAIVPRYNICVGPSMYPTIRSIDNILTETYKHRNDIRVGDIIVYPHPDRAFDVVHRIIKIRNDGIITRGDNNSKTDPYIIKFENIKWKVIAITRGKKTINITGGKAGYIIHKIMLARKFSLLIIRFPLVKLSAFITNSRVLNFLDPLFKLRIVHVTSKDGKNKDILKLGNRAIGKRYEEVGKWVIRFPYKFFIKKEKLK